MTWSHEKYRHSLSSKGVRTKTHIRMVHSKRPEEERVKDEQQLDILTADAELWLSDPNKYDYQNIDTPSPIKIFDAKRKKGAKSKKMVAELDGEIVGSIQYVVKGKLIALHIIYVPKKHEGKGYASYLLREFINMQDKAGKPASLYVFPTEHHYTLPPKEWHKRRRLLKRFYSTFGFVQHPDDPWVMFRQPVKQ